MDYTSKLEQIKMTSYHHAPSQEDVDELFNIHNTEIVGLVLSVKNRPADFLKSPDIVKARTVSLLNNILPYYDYFNTKINRLQHEIDAVSQGKTKVTTEQLAQIEQIKINRLYFIDIYDTVCLSLSSLFILLVETFPESRANEEVRKIAKEFLPKDKWYLVETKVNGQIKETVDHTVELDHETLSLERLILDSTKYNKLKQAFVDFEWIDPETGIWKESGNGSKKLLASVLKSLHRKGYTRSLSNMEITSIARNDFRVKFSVSTVGHADVNRIEIKKIPPA